MTLRTPSSEEVTTNVISVATTGTVVQKGCEAYLAYVIDMKKAESSLSNIPIVYDYPDVFMEEFPGFHPHIEIEFAIDVVPGATPASITLYRMAPVQLKELKL